MRMRAPLLSAVVLLAIVALGNAGPRMSTVEYTPPAQPGDIYTVVDFARSGGTAEATTISEVMGSWLISPGRAARPRRPPSPRSWAAGTGR